MTNDYNSNLHTHTNYSDGSHSPEFFIKHAIKKGLKSYAITDHAPIPDINCKWSMKENQIDKYFLHLKKLKDKYSDDIELLPGLEVDYIPGIIKPSCFQKYNPDILIGSLHFVKSPDGNIISIEGPSDIFHKEVKNKFRNNYKLLVEKYYETILDMINTGDIDIIGHVDKIKINISRVNPNFLQSNWYKGLERKISKEISKFNGFIEINTRGMYKKIINEPYPSVNMIKIIFENGGKLILNGDTHDPDGIKCLYKKTLKILAKEKISYIYTRDCRAWAMFSIK